MDLQLFKLNSSRLEGMQCVAAVEANQREQHQPKSADECDTRTATHGQEHAATNEDLLKARPETDSRRCDFVVLPAKIDTSL
jgi:hypothetical protein